MPFTVSRPPVPLAVSSVLRVVPYRCVSVCGSLSVYLVSLFTRKQGLTVCTEGHRVPYWDLGHHLESRVRARCRVVASSGLAIADFPVINSSCAAALLQNDAGPAGFRNLMVRGRVKMPAAAVRA